MRFRSQSGASRLDHPMTPAHSRSALLTPLAPLGQLSRTAQPRLRRSARRPVLVVASVDPAGPSVSGRACRATTGAHPLEVLALPDFIPEQGRRPGAAARHRTSRTPRASSPATSSTPASPDRSTCEESAVVPRPRCTQYEKRKRGRLAFTPLDASMTSSLPLPLRASRPSSTATNPA